MLSLDDILANPKKLKKSGFDRSSTINLLKIPKEDRSIELEAVLIERNQGLAYDVAKDLWKRFKGRLGEVIDFDDILSAAMHGLWKSIQRFDTRYANEFSTYATHWIRQVALREIENNLGIVRIPIHFQRRLKKIAYFESKNQDSDAHFVAHSLGQRISLNSFLEDGIELIQIIPSHYSFNKSNWGYDDLPEYYTLKKDLHERMEASVQSLMTGKNVDIVKMRFGLGCYSRPHTLEEVGSKFGVTRERIRQIANKYIEKVRDAKLFDYDEQIVFRRIT